MAFSLSASCSKLPQDGEPTCSVHAARRAAHATQTPPRLEPPGAEIELFMFCNGYFIVTIMLEAATRGR